VPDRAERAELLGAVAAACEAAAEVDAAVELHLYAGRPRAALALLMQRFSDALPGSLTNEAKGARGGCTGLPYPTAVLTSALHLLLASSGLARRSAARARGGGGALSS
jgi:hypothetical protein